MQMAMNRSQIQKWVSRKDEGAGMIRPRPTIIKIATRSSFVSCGKLWFALLAIGMCSIGCGKSSQQATIPAEPQTFTSAEIAGQTVYAATKAGDTNALLTIFGSGAQELLFSGDPVQDKNALEAFTQRYDEMHRWAKLTRGGLVLDIGAENYPFPFALKTNSAGQWYFDSDSAKGEILARRVGGNELSTIDVLNAMSDAQAEYFSQPHDGNKSHTYAQKFVSDEGKQNGLYWSVGEDDTE